jgi:protein subunit release factor B
VLAIAMVGRPADTRDAEYRAGRPIVYTVFMPFPANMSVSLERLARELGVRPEDVEEQFVRGSGKGGQKVNKTSSAVMLKHLPTGVVVRGDNHRSQSLNRREAFKLLLLKIEVEKRGNESKLMRAAFKRKKQKDRRSRRAKEKMLKEKHGRAEIKELRRTITPQ